MLKFENFLLLKENTKVNDFISKSTISKQLEDIISPIVLGRINTKEKSLIVKFFVALYLVENVPLNLIPNKTKKDIDELADFIQYQLNKNKSFFAVLRSRKEIEEENTKYHNSLAKKFGKGSSDVLAIINIQNALNEIVHDYNLHNLIKPNEWAGWSWVSLGKRSCTQEAAAGGHCGNSGGVELDNILSLRDRSNTVYLTFIVNNGIIKEAKARFNKKPTQQFHPAILALLMSNYIKSCQTNRGYLPENNFKLEDLEESILKIVKSKFENQNNHETPTNYEHDPKVIESIQQFDVDKLTPKQKCNLLLRIINIFDNNKSLKDYRRVEKTPENEDDLGYENVFKSKVEKINFNFDFNKLIYETIELLNNKQLIEFLDKYSSLDLDNIIYEERSVELWGKNIGEFKIPELKMNAINEEKMIKNISSRSLTTSETQEIIEALGEFGYIETDVGSLEDNNKFSKTISELRNKALNHMIASGKIEDNENTGSLIYEILHEYLYSTKIPKETTRQNKYIFYDYPKKPNELINYFIKDKHVILSFAFIKDDKNNESLNKKITILKEKIKHLLIKRGVQHQLTNTTNYLRESKSHFSKCVWELINDIKNNYLEKLKTHEKLVKYRMWINRKKNLAWSDGPVLMMKLKVIDLLKQIKNDKLVEVEEISSMLKEYDNNLNKKIEKDLDKIVRNNFERIIQCMKKQN